VILYREGLKTPPNDSNPGALFGYEEAEGKDPGLMHG